MPPIDLIYHVLHANIKRDLDSQAQAVHILGELRLDPQNSDQNSDPSLHVHSLLSRAHGQLQKLQDNYSFLEQVYKYHSLVEDEVSAKPVALGGLK